MTADVQAVLDVAVHAWCHDQARAKLDEVQQHATELADLMASIAQVVQTDPDTAVALLPKPAGFGICALRHATTRRYPTNYLFTVKYITMPIILVAR